MISADNDDVAPVFIEAVFAIITGVVVGVVGVVTVGAARTGVVVVGVVVTGETVVDVAEDGTVEVGVFGVVGAVGDPLHV